MTTFTARTPVDLLALVPVVIGFHPEDSVVLLTFGSRPADDGTARAGADSFHARVDLPMNVEDQRRVAATLGSVVEQHQAELAAVVVYSDDAEVAAGLASVLVPELDDRGVEVVDALRTDGERFFRLSEVDDPGTPYDLACHPLTAERVLDGRVVHASREALRDTLIGGDLADVQAVTDAADAFLASLLESGLTPESAPRYYAAQARWLQRVVARHLRHPERLSAQAAGRIVVLVSLDPLREVIWSEMARRNAAAHVELLRALVRRSPVALSAGVAALLGLASWLAGNGALAWCALDRCLGIDPDDVLAQQVAALLESATPPSVWAPIPAAALPIFAGGRTTEPGSAPDPTLGSSHGAGRRAAGVQPG